MEKQTTALSDWWSNPSNSIPIQSMPTTIQAIMMIENALEARDHETVSLLLDKKMNIGDDFLHRCIALLFKAVDENNVEGAKILLSAGANTKILLNGMGVLYYALSDEMRALLRLYGGVLDEG